MDHSNLISVDSVVVRSGELVYRELDGEIVMLSIEQGKYFGLDEVGSRIWELVAQPVQVKRICQILVQEYDVSEDCCRQDVVAFLEKLAAEHVVEILD